MKNFEYAQPRSEREAIVALNEPRMRAIVFAGGTDLMPLMERMVVAPDRVVNIGEIDSLKEISQDSEGNTWIGAGVHLDEFAGHPASERCSALVQVIDGISSVQLQSQGTVVGELLRRPTCWYFRTGHGLLANQGRMIVEGDNRYHAILGNLGPAKFVNASRLAPAMIALGAYVRIIGPDPDSEEFLDIERLYQTPRNAAEIENVLKPGQLVTHVVIPQRVRALNASYEVRHGEGPDQPLAAAAVSIDLEFGRVSDARIVLGQVAPTPWISEFAARSLKGKAITEESAAIAGYKAVADAMALSLNEYKIQLAQVSVKRAILRAAGLETGGLEVPFSRETTPVNGETHFV